MIHSNVDYGNFVCDCTKESILPIIDPVHNAGICVATGAFCMIRLESAYVESGESALSLLRNFFLFAYVAKLNRILRPTVQTFV